MRLKNKKTGEIGGLLVGAIFTVLVDGRVRAEYATLAELNEEWEDHEGPKEYWAIDCFVPDGDLVTLFSNSSESVIENRKSIGNYFETREETEKAVEKLKALTEAKKDGLVIKGYYYNHEDLVILADIGKCNKLTLDTLFGKEID